jgi:hypothetical protein
MNHITKREVGILLTFEKKGTFESLYAAQAWCKQNGYSYGSLCGNEPIALCRGDYFLPQKWKNITKLGRDIVTGVMVSNDFREDFVNVILYKDAMKDKDELSVANFQSLSEAIMRLKFNSIITDTEARKAEGKLFKVIAKHISQFNKQVKP